MNLYFLNSNKTMVNENENDEKIEAPLLSFVIIIHLFIIALGILGNSLIICLVICNIKLRNVRNAFMLNLTCSNLLLITICSPSFLISMAYRSWMMGTFWCKFLHSIQIVIILVSSFSIMMIAIDRWMFVVFSQSRQLKGKDAALIILFIWLVSIMLAMPTFLNRSTSVLYDESLFSKLKEFNNKFGGNGFSLPLFNNPISTNNMTFVPVNITFKAGHQAAANQTTPFNFIYPDFLGMPSENTKYCYERWSDTTYKRVYILILFVLEFVLPCLTMLITYIWIIRFLKVQDNKMNHYQMLHKRLVQKEKHHQKNCKLLSALCVTFIICFLPLSFFNIKAEFDVNKYIDNNDTFKQKEIYSPLTILTTLEEMNTILSPLLYGWMNHNFRNVINEKLNEFRRQYKRVKMTTTDDERRVESNKSKDRTPDAITRF
jgi:hypothetical protein